MTLRKFVPYMEKDVETDFKNVVDDESLDTIRQ